jgi:NAD(P)-dependent dehydrogenase (short-subunit alcohol dehydrogenase family)
VEVENFKRVLDVNLTGIFLFCKEVLPHMVNTAYRLR